MAVHLEEEEPVLSLLTYDPSAGGWTKISDLNATKSVREKRQDTSLLFDGSSKLE